MNQAKIYVPSSSANVGLFFDSGCIGLEEPRLCVTYFVSETPGITCTITSPHSAPGNRELGYAGKVALDNFFKEYDIKMGVQLHYEDDDYPVGGLGRSGAEAVGAILAAAVVNDIRLSREDVIRLSSMGEPGQHMDNVAGSTNGNFNLIARDPYSGGTVSIDYYKVPESLGLVLGVSSHQKTTGTEGMRKVLQYPVLAKDYVGGVSLAASAAAALVDGNVDRFLELVWRDAFHEPRRADIGGYGDFTAEEFRELKEDLFERRGIATVVSGAGPRMAFLYNTDQHITGIQGTVSRTIVPWFNERGMEMEAKDVRIAKEGAYDYAQKTYDYNK